MARGRVVRTKALELACGAEFKAVSFFDMASELAGGCDGACVGPLEGVWRQDISTDGRQSHVLDWSGEESFGWALPCVGNSLDSRPGHPNQRVQPRCCLGFWTHGFVFPIKHRPSGGQQEAVFSSVAISAQDIAARFRSPGPCLGPSKQHVAGFPS